MYSASIPTLLATLFFVQVASANQGPNPCEVQTSAGYWDDHEEFQMPTTSDGEGSDIGDQEDNIIPCNSHFIRVCDHRELLPRLAPTDENLVSLGRLNKEPELTVIIQNNQLTYIVQNNQGRNWVDWLEDINKIFVMGAIAFILAIIAFILASSFIMRVLEKAK